MEAGRTGQDRIGLLLMQGTSYSLCCPAEPELLDLREGHKTYTVGGDIGRRRRSIFAMETNRDRTEVFADLAVMSGLLKPGDAFPAAVQIFAESVVAECAVLGDGYGSEDETAGDQIRASLLSAE